jgi:hypothetical protein
MVVGFFELLFVIVTLVSLIVEALQFYYPDTDLIDRLNVLGALDVETQFVR